MGRPPLIPLKGGGPGRKRRSKWGGDHLLSPLKGEGWETWGRPSYPPKGGRTKVNNPRKSPFKGDLEGPVKGDLEGPVKGDLEGPTERSCLRHSTPS